MRLIDSATGSTLHIFEETRNGAIPVIDRQGDTLATVSWSGERQVTATTNRFKLWHLPSRREFRSIPTKEADVISSMAFSPDGRHLPRRQFWAAFSSGFISPAQARHRPGGRRTSQRPVRIALGIDRGGRWP